MPKPRPLVEILPTAPGCGEPPPPDGGRPLASREDRCWTVTPDVQARLEAKIVAALLPALARIVEQPAERLKDKAREAVAEFFPLYRSRPVRNNKGGGLINDSLCLYVTARLLAPELIVESGSYRGHSAWLLRRACPTAEIFSFDIDHSQLHHREADVIYREGDWSDFDLPPVDPARALVWFDDHINHALRLSQAYGRGFRRALFDDNFPVETLYATGGPPVPTLAMLTDPFLHPGMEIEWTRKGKTYRYRFEEAHTFGARELIGELVLLPDLTSIARYSPPSGMTYVRLAP